MEGFDIDGYGIENDSYSVCNSFEDIENEFAKAKRRISLEMQWIKTFRYERRSKEKPVLFGKTIVSISVIVIIIPNLLSISFNSR